MLKSLRESSLPYSHLLSKRRRILLEVWIRKSSQVLRPILEPLLGQTEALMHLSLIKAILQSSSRVKPLQKWVSSVHLTVVLTVADGKASLHWVCCLGSIYLKTGLFKPVFVGNWTKQRRVEVVKYPWGAIWDNLRVDDKLIGLSRGTGSLFEVIVCVLAKTLVVCQKLVCRWKRVRGALRLVLQGHVPVWDSDRVCFTFWLISLLNCLKTFHRGVAATFLLFLPLLPQFLRAFFNWSW